MTLRVRRRRAARPPGSAHGALLCLALAASAPARAESDLTGLSLEQLMDLSVVGASKYEQTQREVAAAVSVITRDEIRAFGWRTLDAALASLPGIHLTYDRQYTYLGARGFGLPGDFNTRLLVMINGNRVNDATYDSGPVGRPLPIDMELVERIEFIPGPGGAVYGQNAMFGVVNVITRHGQEVGGGELAVAAQDPQRLGEGRVSWGRRLDNGVDVLLSASGLRARGADSWFDFGAAGVSGVARGLDGERDKELFARVGRGPWSAELVYGDCRKDDPTAAFRSDPLLAGQYQSDRYLLAQWQYQQALADDTLHVLGRLFAGEQRYNGMFSYGSRFAFPAVSQWRGGELRLLSTALATHKLMLGLEAQRNVRADQQIEDLSNPAGDIRIPGSGYRAGVYAQDEWRVAAPLTATLGARFEHDRFGDYAASPRAALIWQAAPVSTLKALYGRARRDPNAYERDYHDAVGRIANAALKGERIDTLELVADQRTGPRLWLRAALYRWTMRDLITLGVDPASGEAQYRSGETVRANGLELSFDQAWGGGARLRGSWSLQRARGADGVVPVNSPRWLGKLNWSTPLAGAQLGYAWRYDSRRRTGAGVDLGGYAVSDLHLRSARPVAGVELGLGVLNLFDKRYAQPGAGSNWQDALRQDGRSVRLEALYRF